MKKYPAPLDEKNISTDWLYDQFNSVGDNKGPHYKCAFYRRFQLWEATWEKNDNTVKFRMAFATDDWSYFDEFFDYLKKDLCDIDDERLLVEFSTDRINREFSVSFYWFDEDEI